MESTFYTPDAPSGAEPLNVEIKAAPCHPFVLVAHLSMKIASLLSFLLASLAFADKSNSFVITFIVTTTLVALDFWITKNISGRLLVGLRWWNEIKEDGSNVWVFESLEKEALINTLDQQIFWLSILVFNLVWLLMFLKNVFLPTTWNWAILCGLCLALGVANLTGYIKCAKEARRKLSEAVTTYVVTEAIRNAMGGKKEAEDK